MGSGRREEGPRGRESVRGRRSAPRREQTKLAGVTAPSLRCSVRRSVFLAARVFASPFCPGVACRVWGWILENSHRDRRRREQFSKERGFSIIRQKIKGDIEPRGQEPPPQAANGRTSLPLCLVLGGKSSEDAPRPRARPLSPPRWAHTGAEPSLRPRTCGGRGSEPASNWAAVAMLMRRSGCG